MLYLPFETQEMSSDGKKKTANVKGGKRVGLGNDFSISQIARELHHVHHRSRLLQTAVWFLSAVNVINSVDRLNSSKIF